MTDTPEEMPLRSFDMADELQSADDVAVYLNEAFRDGHVGFIAHAFGVVARSRGMAAVAQAAGLSRESLYKSLSEKGSPSFETVLKVASAIGVRLTVEPVEAPHEPASA